MYVPQLNTNCCKPEMAEEEIMTRINTTTKNKLIVPVAIPGSGKSTLAQRLVAEISDLVIFVQTRLGKNYLKILHSSSRQNMLKN